MQKPFPIHFYPVNTLTSVNYYHILSSWNFLLTFWIHFIEFWPFWYVCQHHCSLYYWKVEKVFLFVCLFLWFLGSEQGLISFQIHNYVLQDHLHTMDQTPGTGCDVLILIIPFTKLNITDQNGVLLCTGNLLHTGYFVHSWKWNIHYSFQFSWMK